MDVDAILENRYTLTDEECKRLNPPVQIRQIDEWGIWTLELDDPYWLPVGLIPRPNSRVAWFVYHLMHGLLMGYPVHKVLLYSMHHGLAGKGSRGVHIMTSNEDTHKLDPTLEEWVELCETAERLLSPHEYDNWQFMVGTSGALTERLALGRLALVKIQLGSRHYLNILKSRCQEASDA